MSIKRLGRSVATATVALVMSASAHAMVDPEFEALLKAAKKHSAEKARQTPQPVQPTEKRGPLLVKFLPKPISGWKTFGNIHDDGDGLIDLSKQASASFTRLNGSQSSSLGATIYLPSPAIGLGGKPKLGRHKEDSSIVVSQITLKGVPAYLSWDTDDNRGHISFTAGRYAVNVEGFGLTSQELVALASNVDIAGLQKL